MKHGGKWMERLAREMEAHGDSIPMMPLVEITGKSRVLIEHHAGVTRYGNEQITVRVSYGTVDIFGGGLELACMRRDQIVICGRIDGVKLNREGK